MSAPALTVVLAHARYRTAGGEGGVVAREAAALRAAGHRVHTHLVPPLADGAPAVATAARAVWNPAAARELEAHLRDVGADVLHVHNEQPTLSPAVFAAGRRAGVRTVWTLHNYRYVCPAATLYRDGGPCEACVGLPFAVPAIVHACYRGSRAASALVAGKQALHRALGTYARTVDAFVVLTAFAGRTLARGGLPPERTWRVPNLVGTPGGGPVAAPDASDAALTRKRGGPALFLGRLAEEKGVATLLDAWRLGGASLPPLRILGDGPDRDALAAAAADLRAGDAPGGVTFAGRRPAADVARALRTASVVLVPSRWYEGFPLVLAEAFAAGTPVVASDLGSLAELVPDAVGARVPATDPADWAAAVRDLLDDAPRYAAQARAARAAYEADLTPARHVAALEAVYRGASPASRADSTAGASRGPAPHPTPRPPPRPPPNPPPGSNHDVS